MTIKPGDQFVHAFWLDANNAPLICRVTKISQDEVYYRPISGGKSTYFPCAKVAKYVAKVIAA
jgi:hypothetical protein